jgi:hypothetical protein
MSSLNGSHPKVLNLSLSNIKKSTSSAQTKTTSSFFRDKGKARMDPPPAPKVEAREKEPLKDTTAQNGASTKSEPLDEAMMEDLVKMEVKEPVRPEEDEDMLLKQFQDCLVENRKRSRSQSIDDEKPKPEKMARKIQGEDVFCKSSVKTWQKPRIKAWEDRHLVSSCFKSKMLVYSFIFVLIECRRILLSVCW